jgi:cell division protein FtsL
MKLIASALMFGLVLLFVWERVDMVRVGYQVQRLKAKKIEAQRTHDELEMKFSALTAPERIAKVATEKLGMMPPQKGQVLLIQQHPSPSSPAEPVLAQVRLAQSRVQRGSQ